VWLRSTTSPAQYLDSSCLPGGRATQTGCAFAMKLMQGFKTPSPHVEVLSGGQQSSGADCAFFVLCYAAAITACIRQRIPFPANLRFVTMATAARLRAALAGIRMQVAGAAANFPDFCQLYVANSC